jgi:hypothetical protein
VPVLWGALWVVGVTVLAIRAMSSTRNNFVLRWTASVIVLATGGFLNSFAQNSPTLANLADAVEAAGGIALAVLTAAFLAAMLRGKTELLGRPKQH